MKLLFWISFAAVGYAYFGYALLLAVLARFRPRPFAKSAATPHVSVIIAAHNEESRLPAKLANLSCLRYPADLLEIVIASDGSTDGTVTELVRASRTNVWPIKPLILPDARGKAFALNQAILEAAGEILVFMDVRQRVEEDAVLQLAACFADGDIGAVSGELQLHACAESAANETLGIYWKIEKAIRKLESQSGSVVGVTGAIYAIRRECFTPLPEGTILDDVLVPMNVARTGKRVVFQPNAVAHDHIFVEQGKEFGRKVRTLTGNYQLLRLAPWLLSKAHPLRFRFLSHKVCRLAVPGFLLLMLVSSSLEGGALFNTFTMFQLIFYALAMLGHFYPGTQQFKPVGVASTFVMLNVAAVVAFRNFILRRDKVWA